MTYQQKSKLHPWNKGTGLTLEHRKKISIAHMGRMYFSPEVRKRISEGNKGKKMDPLIVRRAWKTRRRLGHGHPSEETRRRMSESAKRKPPISDIHRKRMVESAIRRWAKIKIKRRQNK